MTPIVLGMIAVAALMHAAWNVVLKTSGDHLKEVMRKDLGVEVEIYEPDQAGAGRRLTSPRD